MNDQERIPFAKVLAATLDAYGRRPPMPETVELWFQIMKPFTLEQFRTSCQRYLMESQQPPAPGAILALLKPKDDRPGVEEAWALAVRASDEAETVIVTNEIMEAWGVAQPIFNLGDEVGARMAFKESYARLTASPAPAKWWPSIGNDPHKRDTALAEAKRQGLLPAPQVAALLPPPEPVRGNASPEGLKRLKEMMAGLQTKRHAPSQGNEDARKADAQRKAEIAAQVAEYRKEA